MFQFLKKLFKSVYVYHVVYSYKNGRGSIIQQRNRPIRIDEDIEDARKLISKSVGEQVIIENVIRLQSTKKNYDNLWNKVE